MKTSAASGETEADGELGATTESEPAPPAGNESPEVQKEREIDELRRFRVRTVPPDMRRQWMLAETPIVSTIELQDTVPPNKRPSDAPPSSDAPRPLFTTPRVSSTAPTRKLPRVAMVGRPRSRAGAGEERLLRLLIAGWAIIAVAVLLGLALRGGPLPKGAVVPSPTVSEPPRLTTLEVAPQRHTEETADPTPPDPAPPPKADSESSSAPATKAPRSRTEDHRKLPPTSFNASGKIPPAQSPRPESDIKSPLFGK